MSESATRSTQVWCLLIDHQRRPAFGRTFPVMVSPNNYIEILMVKIKRSRITLPAKDQPHHLNVRKLYKLRSPRAMKSSGVAPIWHPVPRTVETPVDLTLGLDKTATTLDGNFV
jgi:hypothetical protein